MKKLIEFTLNGQKTVAEVSPDATLLNLLREEFGLTGAKEGCGVGDCGACTVIVDGRAVNSCIMPALEAEGAEVLTVEGLAAPDGSLDPVQKAFVENGAVQCGFCTPGMVMSTKALLMKEPHPDEGQIRTAIEGNLCRCTGYQQIIDAVKAAAGSKS
ncbi:MAG: (2Fe-2S)-binding protein [Desulfarculaceae bacterium]|jgi:carbon-monoxide dehydrogenase small subunit